MRSWFSSVLTPRILVLWALLLLTAWVARPYVLALAFDVGAPRPVTPRGSLADYEKTAIAIFREASPSVVHVFARAVPADLPGGAAAGAVEVQSGSGVIWDEVGHVVTNYHVIHGARPIGVRLASGAFLPARVIGTAPHYDLAVLQVEGGTPFRPLAIGSSAGLQVGQATFAIGNPFGLDQTLTSGIVSALHRHLPTTRQPEVEDMIQTDAAINPGNSGGPLLDSAGRMIGIDTAILSSSGASAGIGFAIPVDVVNRIVPALIRNGRVPTPGIGIVAAGAEAAARLGIDGVIVLQVLPGSPAQQAGLQGVNFAQGRLGDVIVAVDGAPVHDRSDLFRALDRIGVGGTVKLTVLRGGGTAQVDMKVADVSRAAGATGTQ